MHILCVFMQRIIHTSIIYIYSLYIIFINLFIISGRLFRTVFILRKRCGIFNSVTGNRKCIQTELQNLMNARYEILRTHCRTASFIATYFHGFRELAHSRPYNAFNLLIKLQNKRFSFCTKYASKNPIQFRRLYSNFSFDFIEKYLLWIC